MTGPPGNRLRWRRFGWIVIAAQQGQGYAQSFDLPLYLQQLLFFRAQQFHHIFHGLGLPEFYSWL